MNNFARPTKKLALVILFVSASLVARAQSKLIEKVFRLLPPTLVYGITDATKDSMLKGKTYYPSDNDSESVLAFNYGASDLVKDYLYISMSYETSQRASGMVELRSFDMGTKKLIIVSNSGGVEGINYQQNALSTFIYEANNRLIPYTAKIFPHWSANLFIKPGAPDAVKKMIVNNSNLTFNFSNKNVTLSLNSSFLLNNQACLKWIKGDEIEYTWTGKRFIAGPITFSD